MDPMRQVVFSHLDVSETARRTLDPGRLAPAGGVRGGLWARHDARLADGVTALRSVCVLRFAEEDDPER